MRAGWKNLALAVLAAGVLSACSEENADLQEYIATVKARPGATTPYGAGSVMFDKGEISVYTSTENDAGNVDLVEITFWRENKK